MNKCQYILSRNVPWLCSQCAWQLSWGRRGFGLTVFGGILTNLKEKTGLPKEIVEKMLLSVVSQYSMGRVGNPIDVGNAMLFLAADESSFITGSILGVDGGHIAANVNIKL